MESRADKAGSQAAPALHNRQPRFLSPPVPASVEFAGSFRSRKEAGYHSCDMEQAGGPRGEKSCTGVSFIPLSGVESAPVLPFLFPPVGTGGGNSLIAFDEPCTGYRLEKARRPRHSMRQINDYR